jgi:hypothetical protein
MPTYTGNILTPNGRNMLTAVNYGGLGGPDNGPGVVALHTDKKTTTTPGPWETFQLILQPGSTLGPGMKFALQTMNGDYITAINGGGIGGPNNNTCPIHTDATNPSTWEAFSLNVDDSVNPPAVTISTVFPPAGGTTYFLTAVDGGGIGGPNTQPVHSDATSIGPWQQFTFSAQNY